jgi:exodeoxyribonuclease VII large subunit
MKGLGVNHLNNLSAIAQQYAKPGALPEGTLTVEGVSLYIKYCLEEDPNLRQIWVLGEITSVSQSGKGTYFSLRDPESGGAIACVVWSSYASRLEAKPVSGEQVVVLGSVKTYQQQSRYQLQVVQIRSAGAGLAALRYQQLRDRLTEEGLFDADRKRALPEHPQTIAVITSPNAAAWGDIQRTLLARYPGVRILLSIAIVQGVDAPRSIEQAFDRVAQDGQAEVVILARGGGATEDLACFNDERVVRAVVSCPVPVIAGIGHDRDESLADLAADYAAHTPTAAAERAVPDLQDLMEQHLSRVMGIQDAVVFALNAKTQELQVLQRRLRQVRPDRVLEQSTQRLQTLQRQLIQTVRSRLKETQTHQQHLAEKLATLDPHAVLARGYAVIRSENQVVRSASNLTPGQTIELQLANGNAIAQVMAIDQSSSNPAPE